jgi:hypothetical protein
VKRLFLVLASCLFAMVARGQEVVEVGGFKAITIIPVEGENYNIDLKDADLVKFQPTCYDKPGCNDDDGYSFAIDSIVARPWKPRVLLYLGSYDGYTVTFRHFVPLVGPNKITLPEYQDLVIPLQNHTIELYYDTLALTWRPVL